MQFGHFNDGCLILKGLKDPVVLQSIRLDVSEVPIMC